MQSRTLPYLLILPSLLLAAVVIFWPVVHLVEIASHDVNRFGQLRDFNNGANFTALFATPDFLNAVWRTAVWTVAVVGGALIVSIPVAVILNMDFYGRSVARVIVMLPWAVSLTMTAIVWRWALNGESGMLNSALRNLGLIDSNIQWLASAATAFPMQILVGILVTVPFTTTIFLGGLSSIPDDLYEASSLEGASLWQQFREITFPLLKPFVNIAIVLNTIYVFNSFPIIWVMTQGGPANSTDILVTHLYKLAFRLGKLERPPPYRSSCWRYCSSSPRSISALQCGENVHDRLKIETHDRCLGRSVAAYRADAVSLCGNVSHRRQTAAGSSFSNVVAKQLSLAELFGNVGPDQIRASASELALRISHCFRGRDHHFHSCSLCDVALSLCGSRLVPPIPARLADDLPIVLVLGLFGCSPLMG